MNTARRYRTIQIQAGAHVITAADPLPDDLTQALAAIHRYVGRRSSMPATASARRTATVGIPVP